MPLRAYAYHSFNRLGLSLLLPIVALFIQQNECKKQTSHFLSTLIFHWAVSRPVSLSFSHSLFDCLLVQLCTFFDNNNCISFWLWLMLISVCHQSEHNSLWIAARCTPKCAYYRKSKHIAFLLYRGNKETEVEETQTVCERQLCVCVRVCDREENAWAVRISDALPLSIRFADIHTE